MKFQLQGSSTATLATWVHILGSISYSRGYSHAGVAQQVLHCKSLSASAWVQCQCQCVQRRLDHENGQGFAVARMIVFVAYNTPSLCILSSSSTSAALASAWGTRRCRRSPLHPKRSP